MRIEGTTTRRGLVRVGLAAGLSASVPAQARAQAARGEPLRVGVMTDLSGPFAGAGSQPLFWGAEVAIEMFNERGGVDGAANGGARAAGRRVRHTVRPFKPGATRRPRPPVR